jgi:hypothetical protein
VGRDGDQGVDTAGGKTIVEVWWLCGERANKFAETYAGQSRCSRRHERKPAEGRTPRSLASLAVAHELRVHVAGCGCGSYKLWLCANPQSGEIAAASYWYLGSPGRGDSGRECTSDLRVSELGF